MPERVDPALALDALRDRLLTVAPLLLDATPSDESEPTASLLARISKAVRDSGDTSRLWLLMTAVTALMPTRYEFLRLKRGLQLAAPGEEFVAVLEGCIAPAGTNEVLVRPYELLVDTFVVDVDFSARHGHNTGIQRVVRETTKRWAGRHDPTLVAWTDEGFIMRALTPDERSRVIEWTSDRRTERPGLVVDERAELRVPWNSTIILPEVAPLRVWERLACLAEFSGNTVVMVGYDAIPVTSADDVVPSETDRFVRYLSVVKHADVVAGISASSASEFAGFVESLRGQEATGPAITSVLLPVDIPTEENGSELPRRDSTIPQILCVGTQEPRKNQLGLLAASESLWSQGKQFELLFIGGAAVPLSIPFDKEVDRLRKRGRPITVLRHISDAILHRAYEESRFSVFVSLHEGYGLPVGESLSLGTPVITTKYGSTAEIAAGGGCLTVDPRDDAAIADAMRSLLDDDALLERLTAEARARAPRTWDDYANELWDLAMTTHAESSVR